MLCSAAGGTAKLFNKLNFIEINSSQTCNLSKIVLLAILLPTFLYLISLHWLKMNSIEYFSGLWFYFYVLYGGFMAESNHEWWRERFKLPKASKAWNASRIHWRAPNIITINMIVDRHMVLITEIKNVGNAKFINSWIHFHISVSTISHLTLLLYVFLLL